MAKRNGTPKSVQFGIPRLPIEIPPGWDRMPLHESLREIRRPANLKPDTHYRLVTVKRSRQGVEERGWLLGRDIKTKTQFYVSSGDFLISKRQIVHGACGLVPLELDGSVVSNEYAIVKSKGRIDLTFLRYLSESVYFQQTCFHSSIGVHIEKMIFKLDQWLKWEFDLPPLWEQHKIAHILSTWDKTIKTVEKLIKNSKTQKKALVQQLLTGKQGKEEPSSPWRRVRLGDIAIINPARVTQIAGPIDQSDIALNDQVTFLAMEDVSEAAEILQRQTRTHTEVSKGFPSFRENDVLVAKITPCFENGKGAFATKLMNKVGFGSTEFHVLRAKPGAIAPLYLYYITNSHEFRARGEANMQGSAGQRRVPTDFMRGFSLFIPPLIEQERIARTLSSADSDIRQNTRIRELLLIEKKALMQQLLTGKRRVKINGEAA